MSEQQSGRQEATEAAQHVADSVESWQHGAEESTVREELDEGLADAGVDVPDPEKDELVDQIRDDEEPARVDRADPTDT